MQFFGHIQKFSWMQTSLKKDQREDQQRDGQMALKKMQIN